MSMTVYIVVYFALCVYISSCVSKGVYLKIEKIYRPVEGSIVAAILDARDLLHCSYRCKRMSSVSLYYTNVDNECFCNNATDPNSDYFPHSPELVYGYYSVSYESSMKTTTITTTPRIFTVTPPRRDCSAHGDAGLTENGVYPLDIHGTGKIVFAECIFSNTYGPLTVFQKRYGGFIDFYRGWDEYEKGFGDPYIEYWLGLENIDGLTNRSAVGLYIYMLSNGNAYPTSSFVTYSAFRLDREANYTVTVGGLFSDCVSQFPYTIEFKDGKEFATYDRKGSQYWNVKCAQSAWWFDMCTQFDLNGPIYNGTDSKPFIINEACWGNKVPLLSTIMAIKHKT